MVSRRINITPTFNSGAGSTETLDCTSVDVFDITLDADCTFTFTYSGPSGQRKSFELWLRQDSTGGWTPTWPSSVSWAPADGSYASLGASETLSTYSVLQFVTLNAGTSWVGSLIATGMS